VIQVEDGQLTLDRRLPAFVGVVRTPLDGDLIASAQAIDRLGVRAL
jgi:hypothetical protein